METLLEADGLTRRLADGRTLLGAVSLAVSGGDRIAIRGPAGAGKTLLLRACARLDPVDAGAVFWRGQPVADDGIPAFRRRAAYLAQTPALAAGTVEANLRLPFSLVGHRRRAYDAERCAELLRRLGRDRSLFDRSVLALSGGERQIVVLVRLLQLDPRVLLLDEPTAALDPDTRDRAEELILDWARSDPAGRAYVWVGHDERQAERVATRTLRMDAGALREESA